MATKGATFTQIMADLKARRFSPIYILMGEEAYYIDQISNYIAENVLSPEERDFNQTIVFGADTTAGQVADMARRYPMMAEYQVVIVKEAQNIRSLEALDKYLKAPVKSTILVWCHKNGTIDGRKKTVSLASAVGVVFESKKMRDYELPAFITNYLKEHQATIDPKAAQMIADHIGSDLSRLTSELDKVLISFAGKTDITEICKITEVEGTNTFAPEAEYYYVIYCGEATMEQLGIDAGNSMNFLGLEGSNLDIWPEGQSVEWLDTPENNSFGIAGEYQNPTCADWAEDWYGGGWMIPADQADAVKAIPSDAKFHLCVSSMTPGKEQINLPSNGNEANIILDFGGT
mgnify:CR=1 FL=1